MACVHHVMFLLYAAAAAIFCKRCEVAAKAGIQSPCMPGRSLLPVHCWLSLVIKCSWAHTAV